MLNNRVPSDCTAAAHQSIRSVSHAQERNRDEEVASRSLGALITWRNCR